MKVLRAIARVYRKNKHDMVKLIIIPLLFAMLFTDLAMLVWAIRRDERYEAERMAKIEQCREGTYTYTLQD